MSSEQNATGQAEIVIVRRKTADDLTAGKGGAWKIAYADFVTAMMAFFLVMWLINASNEATRSQVASYFNPIKLTDSATGNRGLKERKERKTTDTDDGGDASVASGQPSSGEASREAALMADPLAVLDRIAEAAAAMQQMVPGGQAPSDSSASSRPSDMIPGIGDPFDPRSWEKVGEPGAMAVPPAGVSQSSPVEPEESSKAELPPEMPELTSPAAEAAAPPPDPPAAGPDTQTVQQDREPPAAVPEPARQQEELAAAIARDISDHLAAGLDQLPAAIEVKAVNDGILISLTDKASFGMFRTGSAEPEPQLVGLVAAVAAALRNRDGFIVIRGHTDSRPYRNKTYDNWQLSTARAHFAQYMLIRGGLDERRIRRIEGMADRDPRNASDPTAAANRRIEILLGLDPS